MANLLLVDDNSELLKLTQRVLERDGHSCTVVLNVSSAVAALEAADFELVISDLLMPDVSGLTFLARVADRAPTTAAIVMTAVNELGVAEQALDLGVYGYVVKPVNPSALVITVRTALRRRESEIQNAQLTQDMTELVHRRTETLMVTIEDMRAHLKALNREHEESVHALSTAAEFPALTPTAHTYRVGRFSALIAKRGGLDNDLPYRIRIAAALHDVGNIGIPRDLLTRPGPISDDEREIMKNHTAVGFRILSGYGSPVMEMAAEIARAHHERWDGSGYPEGLLGSSTPLVGRIVAIADVFDSMVSDRPYRKALSIDEAFTYIENGAGTLFDAELVRVFLGERAEIKRLRTKYRDRLTVSALSQSEFPRAR